MRTTISVRFPKLGNKTYDQAAKQNELKLISRVSKLINDKPVKQKQKKEYTVSGGNVDNGRSTIQKKPKTFVLE